MVSVTTVLKLYYVAQGWQGMFSSWRPLEQNVFEHLILLVVFWCFYILAPPPPPTAVSPKKRVVSPRQAPVHPQTLLFAQKQDGLLIEGGSLRKFFSHQTSQRWSSMQCFCEVFFVVPDWLLNDCKPWHRQSMREITKARTSILGDGFSIGGNLFSSEFHHFRLLVESALDH